MSSNAETKESCKEETNFNKREKKSTRGEKGRKKNKSHTDPKLFQESSFKGFIGGVLRYLFHRRNQHIRLSSCLRCASKHAIPANRPHCSGVSAAPRDHIVSCE